MKPDSHMPFYGDEFFQAVEGQDEITGFAYIRAIWHYWSHLHCAGFDDNKDQLRRVCRVEKSEWDRVSTILFDNEKFFTMDEEGRWRSKRADELWADACARYRRNQAGGYARWGKKQPRNE